MGKEIFVICDSQEYNREDILQIITKAKELGDVSKSRVSTLCVGQKSDEKLSILFQYGTDRVLFCREENQFDLAYFIELIAAMVEKISPDIILFPATVDGKATAAVLSNRFEAGLTADCIEIDFDESGEIVFSRAAINDSVIATIKSTNCNIMMGTVKEGVFVKKEFSASVNGVIEEFFFTGEIQKCAEAWKIYERIPKESPSKIDINQYKKVFCIGRGVKDKIVYERICKLADRYGVGIVGTRAVAEKSLIEKERQVGQSGKSISPLVYIGLGVSGASQHMVGIKNAQVIIAVNNDKDAAIFEYANYSVVENLETILDCLEKLTNKQ